MRPQCGVQGDEERVKRSLCPNVMETRPHPTLPPLGGGTTGVGWLPLAHVGSRRRYSTGRRHRLLQV